MYHGLPNRLKVGLIRDVVAVHLPQFLQHRRHAHLSIP